MRRTLAESEYTSYGNWLDVDSPMDTVAYDVRLPSDCQFVAFVQPYIHDRDEMQTGPAETSGMKHADSIVD